MTNIKKWLGFVVWGLLALPMISIVLTSYLLAPIIAHTKKIEDEK